MPGRPDGDFAAAVANAGLVIFDFDGVIADSEVISLSSLGTALARAGIPMALEEVRRRFLGASLKSIGRLVAEHRGAEAVELFRADWESVLFARFRRELSPVPGIEALLDRLSARGLPSCIASSGTFERIGVALDAMGLAPRFAHVFSAEEVTHGKPAPDLFLHAAARMGVAPSTCLVIEDSVFGVRAAQGAGMRSLGFVGGAHLQGMRDAHAEELLRSGAAAILKRHDDLLTG